MFKYGTFLHCDHLALSTTVLRAFLCQGLRSLFGTLIVSLPAFWNVGALLGLLFFMYAYVGMLLLGNIKLNG